MVGTIFQILFDFRLRRKHAAPVGIGREGKRIQMGWHVAGTAGVVIYPPGAADTRLFLKNDEIIFTLLLEANRHAQAGKPGADNRHLMMLY